jgi:hypothetical protein
MPRVWPLNSQVAFLSQFSGAVFNIAELSKGFHGSCLDRVSFPMRPLTLFHLSVFFVWLIPFFFGNARVVRRVLIHSSNRLPSGNCDSPGFETSPSYLTEFGTVSNRSSSLSPFFAFTDSARTLPEELVNSASAFRPFDPLSEELSQPA